MSEKAPPLFIKLTHLHGIALRRAAEPVPANGLILGREAIKLMAGADAANGGIYAAGEHAGIFPGDMIWRVQALDKDFITVINGMVIAPEASAAVSPGDILELGFARIMFTDGEEASPAPPEAAQRGPEAAVAEPALEAWREMAAVAEPADAEAALEAWREMAAIAEGGDILKRLGHEGLRVLNNPDMLNHPERPDSPLRWQERAAGRETGKDLWRLCGAPAEREKSLTDFVMGEMSIDDVLAGLGRIEEAEMAEEEDAAMRFEDPLAMLGHPGGPSGGATRKKPPFSRPGAPLRPGITLDSHYDPTEPAKANNMNNKEKQYDFRKSNHK